MDKDRTASQSFRYVGSGGFQSSNSSGRVHTVNCAGGLETAESTDDVTGIQFEFGSGNIENLHVKCWGLSGTDAV